MRGMNIATLRENWDVLRAKLRQKFPVLRDNDHLADGGSPGTLELAGQKVIPIRTYEDIVV